jgi:thioredoxin 1
MSAARIVAGGGVPASRIKLEKILNTHSRFGRVHGTHNRRRWLWGHGPRACGDTPAQAPGDDCSHDGRQGGPHEPIEVNDGNIEEVAGKYPALIVDCWAEWCGPCRVLGPTIKELAGELKGKVVFGKLNTDLNPKTPRQYGIMSIPTLLFYKDGQVTGKLVGAVPKEYIMEAVEKTYGKL